MTLGQALFITGYSKSGTTLLLALLDSHPELLVFPRESEFFTVAKAELEHDPPWGLRRFVRRCFGAPQFGMRELLDSPVDLKEYEAALKEEWSRRGGTIPTFLEAAIIAYGQVTGLKDRKWWVEKTPKTELQLPLLASWYPGLRSVFVLRDPRANYAAMKRWREREGASFGIPRFCHEWMTSLRAAERSTSRLPLLIVRYEDLVCEPRATLSRVCDFLGIGWSDTLLRPTLAGAPFGGNSIYGGQTQQISTASLERWKSVLTPEEVSRLERILRPLMERYDYELFEANPTGPGWRPTRDRLTTAAYSAYSRFLAPLRHRMARRRQIKELRAAGD